VPRKIWQPWIERYDLDSKGTIFSKVARAPGIEPGIFWFSRLFICHSSAEPQRLLNSTDFVLIAVI
jgi:hypothetical protein